MDGCGHRTMPRRLGWVAGLAAACAVLAACSTGNRGPSDDGGATRVPAAIGTSVVSGVGTVLVDSTGKTLYFTDQDAGGTIHCTGPCMSFWSPATASSNALPPGSIPGLSVIRRPDDGQEQFAYQGRPLYEFKLDGMAGQVNGNEAHDEFSGMSFTWHAAVVDGTAPAAPSSLVDAGGPPGY